MDSETTGEINGELNSRGRFQWTENCKVYTRRSKLRASITINNNDAATTTTTNPQNPTPTASAASENPTTAPPPTEISSATLASPTTAGPEVSTTSTYEEPNDSAAVSHGPTKHCSPAPTTTTLEVAGNEPLEALVAEDEGEQSPLQEQSLSHRPSDKDEDSFLQLQEEKHQHQQLEDKDKCLTQDSVKQSSATRTAELQNHEDLSLPFHSASELPLTSDGGGAQNLSESSPLSGEVMPNGRQLEGAEQPIGSDEELATVPPQVPSDNGAVNINGVVKPLVISRVDDRVRFNLSKAAGKNDIKELRKKLDCELDQVRKLVKQLEDKELQLASYNSQISYSNHSNSRDYIGSEGDTIGGYGISQSQHARVDMVDSMASMRVNSEMGVVSHPQSRPVVLARMSSDVGAVRNLDPRPYSRQLSVAVMENNHGANEFVEKEKRTPKANQYYRNSEFLLGKDRLPPESNKRMKTNNGRKHNLQTEHAYGFGYGYDKSRNQVFRSCSSLLQRLMKHKHGWVFNEPVDAKALGLVDYHDVIKHPMDLGTIKTRLSQNMYNSPREFAEDVRLVFRNAMTYNPKGQDVHVMAEQLSQIFEERWAIIETEYNPYWKYQMYQDTGIPTPTSRKAPFQSHYAPVSVPGFVPVVPQAPVYVSAPASAPIPLYAPAAPPMAVDTLIQRHHVGRAPVPKKPKAKDLNKRDMTYEEKQRLSTNLQGLPSEKLDAIVQIIKKRSTALSQHDDEIEVDIDNVDAETLWELDRFVTNYKKSLSKNKRKAELALQARMANQNAALTNTTQAVTNTQMESGTAFTKNDAPPTAEGEKQGYNGNRSSSSSSSSSDSGSSSSDSDSDSSSADGSDAGHSPRT
ncbi:hypothetical protein ACJIZ3_011132 [Penstemon smallii]|uniref:Transcription factor GTE4 n=1 Tax=Penstemon smallii TaxID=265156 RepID=A0ABD3ULU4_9LAMI